MSNLAANRLFFLWRFDISLMHTKLVFRFPPTRKYLPRFILTSDRLGDLHVRMLSI